MQKHISCSPHRFNVCSLWKPKPLSLLCMLISPEPCCRGIKCISWCQCTVAVKTKQLGDLCKERRLSIILLRCLDMFKEHWIVSWIRLTKMLNGVLKLLYAWTEVSNGVESGNSSFLTVHFVMFIQIVAAMNFRRH